MTRLVAALERIACAVLAMLGATMLFAIVSGVVIAARILLGGWTLKLWAQALAIAALYGWASGLFLLALVAWCLAAALRPERRP